MGMRGWRESQRDGEGRRETETVKDGDRDGGERETQRWGRERHRGEGGRETEVGEGERQRWGSPRRKSSTCSKAFHKVNNVGKGKGKGSA